MRPTRSATARCSKGTTTSPVRGQKRKAWWSDSASDQPGPRVEPVQPRRAAQVGDVEDRDLCPGGAAVVGRVLADPEQQVVADRVQVGRVAGDLQLPEDARLLRDGEIERVERIDLPERDDVAHVTDEAHGVDPLALAEPADPAGLSEGAVPQAQRRQERLALAAPAAPPGGALGAHDPQHAAVLRERPLAEQEAGHAAAAAIQRPRRAGDVERVDGGRDALLRVRRPVRVRSVGPALGRDVEALRRGVDDPRVGEDGDRVHRLEPLGEVDRQHGQHAEPGEGGRPAHVAALDERARLSGAARAAARRDRRAARSRGGTTARPPGCAPPLRRGPPWSCSSAARTGGRPAGATRRRCGRCRRRVARRRTRRRASACGRCEARGDSRRPPRSAATRRASTASRAPRGPGAARPRNRRARGRAGARRAGAARGSRRPCRASACRAGAARRWRRRRRSACRWPRRRASCRRSSRGRARRRPPPGRSCRSSRRPAAARPRVQRPARSAADHVRDHATAEPIWPDEARRLRLRVGQQVGARAEGHQATGLGRGGWARPRAFRLRADRAGQRGEQEQAERCEDA